VAVEHKIYLSLLLVIWYLASSLARHAEEAIKL